MIRIRLPGGRVSAGQLRAIAELARCAGNDRVALTNLANFQVRGLERIGYSDLKRHLHRAGLLPQRLWADRRRNILGDPLSGLAAGELVPSQQIIDQLDAAIQAEPLMKASSLKFGFVVDGGGPSHIGAQLHDAAVIAEQTPSGPRLRLYLSGRATGLSASPDQAAGLVLAAAKAALGFAAKGDSIWLKRLKHIAYGPGAAGPVAGVARGLLALAGPQETRIRRLLEHVSWDELTARIRALAPPQLPALSEPPSSQPALAPAIGIIEQNSEGKVLCGFGVPLGRLDSQALELIGALADEYGNGELRLSPWHVVFIPHVPQERAEALLAEAAEAGFATGANFLRFDLSACSGRSGCRGARLETQNDALAVMKAVGSLDLPQGQERLSVHVSGCPKGCAHRQPSDILALEREDGSGYYLYEDSAALTPDMASRFNGTMGPEQLPDAVCRLIVQRSLASGPSSGHNSPDPAAD